MANTLDRTSEADPSRQDVAPHQRWPERTSILGGAVWMIAISLALFFLPAINGLVAGAVGGYKVGGVRRALLAALIPAAALAVIVWVVFIALDMALLGAFAGVAVGVVVAVADLGLFVGAAAGGYFGRRPELPEARVRP